LTGARLQSETYLSRIHEEALSLDIELKKKGVSVRSGPLDATLPFRLRFRLTE
jgi:hypothetical protein